MSRINRAGAVPAATHACGRPRWCRPESGQPGSRSGHGRMSGLSMQHSFAAGPYGVRGPDPDRSSGLEALRPALVLPTPSSVTFVPVLSVILTARAGITRGSGRHRRACSARYSVPGNRASPFQAVTPPRPSPPVPVDPRSRPTAPGSCAPSCRQAPPPPASAASRRSSWQAGDRPVERQSG